MLIRFGVIKAGDDVSDVFVAAIETVLARVHGSPPFPLLCRVIGLWKLIRRRCRLSGCHALLIGVHE